MKQHSIITTIIYFFCFILVLMFCQPAVAGTFCDEVLDSYDFEARVFAGPDPDHLPTVINQYVSRRVEHEVLKGELTRKEARFFMQTAIGEMHLFQSIAATCKRQPKSGIRLIDRLIEPHMKSAHLVEEKTDRANRAAEDFLPRFFNACQDYWMETDALNLCTLQALQHNPESKMAPEDGLKVDVVNGTMTGFEARARHREGNITYRVTAEGTVAEFQEE